MAVDPGVSISGLRDEGSAFQARFPLMAELELSDGISLRPTLISAYAHRIDERRTAVLLGGSVGVGLRLRRGVTLEPAVSLLVDPDIAFNYYGAGLGLQLGGAR